MGSDNVDRWVKNSPESWAKLANTDKKVNFDEFKKKFVKGARENGKYNAVKHMTNAQIQQIYQKSSNAIQGSAVTLPTEKAFKMRVVTVKRQNKTYTRTVSPRWEKHTQLAISVASKQKPRSKEYNETVNNIVKSTGRSRQAVIKKIQRSRKR